MDRAVSLRTAMRERPLPNHLILKIVLAKNLVQHDFDVMRSMPIAVIVEAPRWLQNAREFHTTRTHEIDIRLSRCMPILKRPLLFRLSPENLIAAIRVERRIDVNQ